jgi:hypothetical protein
LSRPNDPRQRRVGREGAAQDNRPAARAAAAMRRRERLVEIDVHGVDAEIGRTDAADDRVEIGAVAIEIGADRVHRFGDRDDVVFEKTAGVRIGQHEGGDVGVECRLQRIEINAAASIGGDRLDGIAAGGRRRRIGAMRRFGNQDTMARLAPGVERGMDRQQAAKLAMSAGGRAHRHRRHAGQRLQPMRQRIDQLQRALHGRDRLERMEIGKTG